MKGHTRGIPCSIDASVLRKVPYGLTEVPLPAFEILHLRRGPVGNPVDIRSAAPSPLPAAGWAAPASSERAAARGMQTGPPRPAARPPPQPRAAGCSRPAGGRGPGWTAGRQGGPAPRQPQPSRSYRQEWGVKERGERGALGGSGTTEEAGAGQLKRARAESTAQAQRSSLSCTGGTRSILVFRAAVQNQAAPAAHAMLT